MVDTDENMALRCLVAVAAVAPGQRSSPFGSLIERNSNGTATSLHTLRLLHVH